MRLLVVGAGASYAEAHHAGLPEELRPPFMKNFAKKMWHEYNPHYLLAAFLREEAPSYDPGMDARQLFIELEEAGTVNISVERFFEYAHANRYHIQPGHERFDPASEYENLLHHGILNPLVFLLGDGLFKDGMESTRLALSKTVAGHLQHGDTVLNLNYDTIFEIGAEQASHVLSFLPKKPKMNSLAVCKPHGSMNLFVNEEKGTFYFSPRMFAGSVQPADGSKNYLGLVPPRLNKAYSQHPIAHIIINSVKDIRPSHVIFWGVGFTDSDEDLLDLFREWCRGADKIDFINPCVADVENAEKLLGRSVQRHNNVSEWSSGINSELQ